MSCALSSLDPYDVVNPQTINEVMAEYSDHEWESIYEGKGFSYIWKGGILQGGHLILKAQVSSDAWGRLLYNGRPYNRNSWSYMPPKFIRLQGRQAKEFSSFFNSYPTDVIEVDNEKVRIRRTCGCGGKLVYDKRAWLYCEKCHLIDNDID